MSTMVASMIEREPLIRFGRAICGDLDAALRREWLVTNGLGGYASGTIAGVNTRRYHGLLVAALAPPVERTVLVAGLVGWVSHEGQRHSLAANEYADGTIDPRGYANVEAFYLDGTLPVWTYALGEARLERRVWMAYGSNTTYVSYELLRAGGSDSPERLAAIVGLDVADPQLWADGLSGIDELLAEAEALAG